MDPVKIIIFVAAVLLLLLLGRRLSAAEDVRALESSNIPQPPDVTGLLEPGEEREAKKAPAVVGVDLPFPIQLPELEMDDDGRYNRPEFLNYYFGEIDLVQGPPDANCFADELFIETRNPEDQRVFTYKYVVATPGGLQQTIDKEHLPALHFDGQVVVVSAGTSRSFSIG